MGRELKRVPMDFDWPQGKLWEGYINPHYEDLEAYSCPDCEGTGYSLAHRLLTKLWYRHLHLEALELLIAHGGELPKELRVFAKHICFSHVGWDEHLDQGDVDALVKKNRLMNLTHTLSSGLRWVHPTDNYIPTARDVNEWSRHGLGHDSSNCYICCDARCERYGVDDRCPLCEGNGNTAPEELRQRYETWEQEEPLVGEGYQLWETTTEGSPASPVFASLEELCEWLARGATTFGSSRATAKEWHRMLSDGLVCHREGNAVFL